MADYFVEVEVETDESSLKQRYIDRQRDAWGEDWDPADGDLGVIQFEAVLPIGVNLAETVAKVPPEIFRNFGTKLHGIPYIEGTYATVDVTFTFRDSSIPNLIKAHTEILIDNYAFEVPEDISVPTGQATVTTTVRATEFGEDKNGLTGTSRSMLSSALQIESFTVTGESDGGTSEEGDPPYLNRLSRLLQSTSETVNTVGDFERLGLTIPTVGRILVKKDTVNRLITVVPAKSDGTTVSSGTKTALLDFYNLRRMATWNVVVQDGTYTAVSVVYEIKVYEDLFEKADVLDRVDLTLSTYLTPQLWGFPKNFGDPGQNTGFRIEPVIRVNKIIDLIGDVDGVDYVGDVTITGTAGTTAANGDLTLPGLVPLPTPGTFTGTAL